MLTFDRPLAEEQEVRPFYLQYGGYLPIHPAGTSDPYYGGPAADVFEIEGERLIIWANTGGLHMGVVMVVIPKRWKAADGSVLKEDVSFLVSQAALTPHKRLSALIDPDDSSETPLLWILQEPGGPPVGYALKDGVPVASEPGGAVIRELKAGNGFRLEPEKRDGWRRITYYTPMPDAVNQAIPATANVYEDERLTTAHSGWVPAQQIPGQPGLVGGGRSLRHLQHRQRARPLRQRLRPPCRLGILAFETAGYAPDSRAGGPSGVLLVRYWDDLPGHWHSAGEVLVNDKMVSTLDPRAHPVLLGMSDEAFETFRRARRHYLSVLEEILRSTPLAPIYMAYRDLIIETAFLNGARLEDAWLCQ
ncbi:hypothetical protein [Hydrogenibacillus sp. N12]|uniref:hypothetical protein n=1 Tax=Hydrogenibacillus sp. N12 TaxID=2866627 RepID=UPI001C7DFC48|nr:hypothetical protein [Hydrogenibacillus sp. N12]QZA33039.1 hypothetical protein K2M58_00090 [Hydrogenibacillus sp. N12]